MRSMQILAPFKKRTSKENAVSIWILKHAEGACAAPGVSAKVDGVRMTHSLVKHADYAISL